MGFSEDVRKALRVIPVRTVDEVLAIALAEPGRAKSPKAPAPGKSKKKNARRPGRPGVGRAA